MTARKKKHTIRPHTPAHNCLALAAFGGRHTKDLPSEALFELEHAVNDLRRIAMRLEPRVGGGTMLDVSTISAGVPS